MLTMTKGIGYQEERQRRIAEGYSPGSIENTDNGRPIIYFGRAHVIDHETKTLARGLMKMGKAKFASALMRGRNQPDVDFRIYAEIVLKGNHQTAIAEKLLAEAFEHKKVSGRQGQEELYDISDSELPHYFNEATEILNRQLNLRIKEATLFNLDDNDPHIETVMDNAADPITCNFDIFFR